MLKDTFNGIKAYFNALGLISKLKLWKYFVAPVLISILTGALIISLAFLFSESVGNLIASVWNFDWGAETVSVLSHWIGGLLVFALGIVIYKHIVMALSAPFMGPVSEKIEHHLTGKKPDTDNSAKGMWYSLSRGIRINVRNLLMEFLFIIPLLIIGLIPVIGIVSTFLIFLVQAYYAGFGNMDYTLERHLTYKQSIPFVRKNRGVAYGNGLVYMFLLLVPFVGIIITLPLSTVAATTQTLKPLQQLGKVELLDPTDPKKIQG